MTGVIFLDPDHIYAKLHGIVDLLGYEREEGLNP
jgi:hypothetical protein